MRARLSWRAVQWASRQSSSRSSERSNKARRSCWSTVRKAVEHQAKGIEDSIRRAVLPLPRPSHRLRRARGGGGTRPKLEILLRCLHTAPSTDPTTRSQTVLQEAVLPAHKHFTEACAFCLSPHGRLMTTLLPYMHILQSAWDGAIARKGHPSSTAKFSVPSPDWSFPPA
eukprot:scaffold24_cov245-Pinguiococcus_pyrenoidosus.AAC.29